MFTSTIQQATSFNRSYSLICIVAITVDILQQTETESHQVLIKKTSI